MEALPLSDYSRLLAQGYTIAVILLVVIVISEVRRWFFQGSQSSADAGDAVDTGGCGHLQKCCCWGPDATYSGACCGRRDSSWRQMTSRRRPRPLLALLCHRTHDSAVSVGRSSVAPQDIRSLANNLTKQLDGLPEQGSQQALALQGVKEQVTDMSNTMKQIKHGIVVVNVDTKLLTQRVTGMGHPWATGPEDQHPCWLREYPKHEPGHGETDFGWSLEGGCQDDDDPCQQPEGEPHALGTDDGEEPPAHS